MIIICVIIKLILLSGRDVMSGEQLNTDYKKILSDSYAYYRTESLEYIQDLESSSVLIRKWRQKRLSETFETRLNTLEQNLTLSNNNLIEEYNNFKNQKGSDILDDSLLLRLAHLYFENENLKFNKKMKDYQNMMSDYVAGRIRSAPEMPSPNYATAIQYAKKVITDFDSSPLGDRAHYLIGYSYDEMGQFERAIAVYERLIQNYPYSTYADEVMWRLGEYYYNAQMYKNARYYYAQLGQSKGVFKYRSVYKLGATYFALKDYEKSYQTFKILVDLITSKSETNAEDSSLYDESISYLAVLKSHGIKIALDENVVVQVYQNLGETYARFSNEKALRAIYNETLQKYPYAKNTPYLFSKLIESYESENLYETANRIRSEFINLMTQSELWWSKNDKYRSAVFLAEDLLEESLIMNARYFSQIAYKNRSQSTIEVAKVRYERFIKNYSYSNFSDDATIELADLEYFSGNYQKAAEWYLKAVQKIKSPTLRESAGYNYLWSKVKQVNYDPGVSREFQISTQKQNLSTQEQVFIDASNEYLVNIDKGPRRLKIMLKAAQIYAAKGDLNRAENILNELVSSRDTVTQTTVKAFHFLESIYNLKSDWPKLSEIRELLPLLRLSIDTKELTDLNSLANYHYKETEDLETNGQYDLAIEKLKQYLTSTNHTKNKSYILLKLSILNYKILNFKLSLEYANQLVGTRFRTEAIYLTAKNYRSLTHFELAAQYFEKFLNVSKNHPWAEEARLSAAYIYKSLGQWQHVFDILNTKIEQNKNPIYLTSLFEAALKLGRHKYIFDLSKSIGKNDFNNWVVAQAYFLQSQVQQKNWNSIENFCKLIPQIQQQLKSETAYFKYTKAWCDYGLIQYSYNKTSAIDENVVAHLKSLQSSGINEVFSKALTDLAKRAREDQSSKDEIEKLSHAAWENIKYVPFHEYANEALRIYTEVFKKYPLHIGQFINWRLYLTGLSTWKTPIYKDISWEAILSLCEGEAVNSCIYEIEKNKTIDSSTNSIFNLMLAYIRAGDDQKAVEYIRLFAESEKYSNESVWYFYLLGISQYLPVNKQTQLPDPASKYFGHLALAEALYNDHKTKQSEMHIYQAISIQPNQPVAYGVLARMYFERELYQLALLTLEEGVNNSNDSGGLFALKTQMDASIRRYGRIGYTYEALQHSYLSAYGLALTALKTDDSKLQNKIKSKIGNHSMWAENYLLMNNIWKNENIVIKESPNAFQNWLYLMNGYIQSDNSNLASLFQKLSNVGIINPMFNQLKKFESKRGIANEVQNE